MSAVIWVSAVMSVAGALVWLGALVWAARQDGQFARAYEKRFRPPKDGPQQR